MKGLGLNLAPRIALFFYVLAAALFGLAANKAVSFALGTSKLSFTRSREALSRVTVSGNKPVSNTTSDRYVAIKPDRFCSRDEEEKPIVKVEGSGYKAVYILRGTLIHSKPTLSRAFIEVPGVSEQKAYSIGDSVYGATITDIKPGEAILKRGDQTLTLKVSYKERSFPASSVWNPSEKPVQSSYPQPPEGPRNRHSPQIQPSGWSVNYQKWIERQKRSRKGYPERYKDPSWKRDKVSRYSKLSPGLVRLLQKLPPDQREAVLQADPYERGRLIKEFLKQQKEIRRRQRSR